MPERELHEGEFVLYRETTALVNIYTPDNKDVPDWAELLTSLDEIVGILVPTLHGIALRTPPGDGHNEMFIYSTRVRPDVLSRPMRLQIEIGNAVLHVPTDALVRFCDTLVATVPYILCGAMRRGDFTAQGIVNLVHLNNEVVSAGAVSRT